jgi:hypothetical protein
MRNRNELVIVMEYTEPKKTGILFNGKKNINQKANKKAGNDI